MPRQVTRRFRGTTVIDNLRLKNVSGGPFDEIGRVYHINTGGALYAGDDANSGLEYEHPMLTIKGALGRCVAGRNDYILVHDYWRPTGEDWPIVINKKKVHIVGVAQRGLPYPAIHPSDNVDAFQLSSLGQYGSIEYLTIGGGAAAAGIEIGAVGQVDGFVISENIFGHRWFGGPLNGIRQIAVTSKGGNGNVINRNHFLGNWQGKGVITGNAIDMLVAGPLDRCFYQLQILENWFHGITGVAINLTRDNGGEVLDNRFVVPDGETGEAITLRAACLGTMVEGNRAMSGMLNAGYTYNPFRDLATNTYNHWGMNYRGNSVIETVGV